MVSPSSLKPSAPSAHLLRFLRSQFHDRPYFSPVIAHCRTQSWTPRDLSRRNSSSYYGSPTLPGRVDGRSPCNNRFQILSTPPFIVRTRNPRSLRYSPIPCTIFNEQGVNARNIRYYNSTAQKNGFFLRRLFGRPNSRSEAKLQPNDLPGTSVLEDGYEGNLFNVGRTLGIKATNEPRLRCTEFDENGNVTLVNGEFKKSELIAKASKHLHFSNTKSCIY